MLCLGVNARLQMITNDQPNKAIKCARHRVHICAEERSASLAIDASPFVGTSYNSVYGVRQRGERAASQISGVIHAAYRWELLEEIRRTLNKELAPGNERFKAQIEKLTGRRVLAKQAGCPVGWRKDKI
jgi:hypothetical protein